MNKSFVLLIFSYLAILTKQVKFLSESEEKQCKILVLEGGGDNGAYQAGALKALLETKESSEVNYDIITGVSLGAFNAAILASYPIGQEKEAAKYIENSWRNLDKDNIYKNWFPFGVIEGITSKEGFYNSEPEEKKMKEVFKDRTLERNLVICATNALTGKFECFNDAIIKEHGVTGAIMASTAFPPLFPSYKYIGNNYYDGTIKHSMEYIQAINECVDKGFTKEQIVVDILLCNSPKITQYSKDDYHVFNSLMRLIEIISYDLETKDYEYFKKIYPDIKIRYLVEPSQAIPDSKHPYEFKKSDIDFMIQLGYNDALNVFKEVDEKSN